MPGGSGTIGSAGGGAGGSSSSSSALQTNAAVNGNSRSTSLTITSSNFSGKANKGTPTVTEVARAPPAKTNENSKAAWFPGGATENRPGAVSWPSSRKKGGAGTEAEEEFAIESRPRSSGAASSLEARRKREQDLCVKIGSYHLLDGDAGRKPVSRIPTRSGTAAGAAQGSGEAAANRSLAPITLDFPTHRQDHHHHQNNLRPDLSPVFEADPMPNFAPPEHWEAARPDAEHFQMLQQQPRPPVMGKAANGENRQAWNPAAYGQFRRRLPLAMGPRSRGAGNFRRANGGGDDDCGTNRGNVAAAAALRRLQGVGCSAPIAQIAAGSLRDTNSKLLPKDRGPLQVAVVQPDGELELQSVSSSDVDHAIGNRSSPEERIMLLRKKQRLERISEEHKAGKVQHVHYHKKKARAGVGCLSKLLLQEHRCGTLTKTPPREAFFQAW
mmetsp:Transcript_77712/g.170144  ORF Transcript_77712/g.170144 Transcript_77712/m.170144 type:complete len:441 (+) Transcript_77712:376-1698(+)